MSFAPADVYACAPGTSRGRGTAMGAHAGKGLLVYANGNAVVVRSLRNPGDVRMYTEHRYQTTCAQISPSGEWVASGDVSGAVRVWGLNGDMSLKAEHQPLSGAVDDIQWSLDGQRIVCCGDGKGSFAKAFLWDSGGSVGDISGMTKRVNSICIRPTKPLRVVTASEDFSVTMFVGPPFKFHGVKHKHGNFALCVRYSWDGSLFVSVGGDGTGVIYDGKTGTPLAMLPKSGKAGDDMGGHVGTVYQVAWAPDGQSLLTVGADKTAKVWNVSGIRPLAEDADDAPAANPLPSLTAVRTYKPWKHATAASIGDMQVGCVFVGDTAVTLSLDGTLHVLSSDGTDTVSKTVAGHGKPVVCMARVFRDGFLSVGLGSVHVPTTCPSVGFVWGGIVGFRKSVALPHAGAVVAAAHTATGDTVFTIGLDDFCFATSFTSDDAVPETTRRIAKIPFQPTSVSTSHDGDVVAVAGGEFLCAFFGGAGDGCNEKPHTIKFPDASRKAITCAGVSCDGNRVLIGFVSGTTELMDVKRHGDAVVNLWTKHPDDDDFEDTPYHQAEVTAVAFHPKFGNVVATCDANRKLFVWQVDTREVLDVAQMKLTFHTARITSVAWSPCGQYLASGSLDGSVIVWDPVRDKCGAARVTIKNAHRGGVTSLVWRDHETLCSGGFDACVKTWWLRSVCQDVASAEVKEWQSTLPRR